MADETQGNGTTAPQGAPGDISALFGEGATHPKGEGTSPPTEAPEPPETYVEGRVPKAFYREDGQHDYNGLSKSWFDTRSAYQTAQARIKELEAAAAESAPEAWEAYAAKLDWEAVKARAPNAYLGGGDENTAAMALLRRLHEQGMPLTKAQAFTEAYYEDLNGLVPERRSDDERLKAAVGSLGPNGPAIASEVQSWLAGQHARQAFSTDQLEVLKQMTHDGTALSLLQRLARQGASTAPPGALPGMETEKVDPAARRAELERRMGAMSDTEFAAQKDALEAEWRQLSA